MDQDRRHIGHVAHLLEDGEALEIGVFSVVELAGCVMSRGETLIGQGDGTHVAHVPGELDLPVAERDCILEAPLHHGNQRPGLEVPGAHQMLVVASEDFVSLFESSDRGLDIAALHVHERLVGPHPG